MTNSKFFIVNTESKYYGLVLNLVKQIGSSLELKFSEAETIIIHSDDAIEC